MLATQNRMHKITKKNISFLLQVYDIIKMLENKIPEMSKQTEGKLIKIDGCYQPWPVLRSSPGAVHPRVNMLFPSAAALRTRRLVIFSGGVVSSTKTHFFISIRPP